MALRYSFAMNHFRALLLAPICSVFLFFAFGASATTLPSWGPDEIFAKSALVARARVVSSHAEWVESSESERIVTFYNVEVLELFKGETSQQEKRSTVIVALPGGVVEGIGQKVHAVPTLKTGEEWILHLSEDVGPDGARGVVTFAHGAHRISSEGQIERTRYDARVVDSPSLDTFRQDCKRLSALPRGSK